MQRRYLLVTLCLVPLLLLPLLLLPLLTSAEELVLVRKTLRQGEVEGRGSWVDGRFICGFNVPYAEAPIGERRFKDPVPHPGWSGIRDGTNPPAPCSQVVPGQVDEDGGPLVVGEEDCLYLIAYSPKHNDTSANLPVLVYVTGGRFLEGGIGGLFLLPLLHRDVLLVTVQYRLNTMGFLSTGDGVIPGNQGIKDVLLALHWVRDNIRDLGGDPGKVTLAGDRAGAAIVDMLTLSDKAKGLFHRVILTSGSSLNPWAFRRNPGDVAATIGRTLRCPGLQYKPSSTPSVPPSSSHDLSNSSSPFSNSSSVSSFPSSFYSYSSSSFNSSALLECVMNANVSDLVKAAIFDEDPLSTLPCVDGEVLVAPPAVLLGEGRAMDVEAIMGVNKDEGEIAFEWLAQIPDGRLDFGPDFPRLGPKAFNVGPWEEDPAYLAQRMSYHYLDTLQVSANKTRAVQMFTDIQYRLDLMNRASVHVRNPSRGQLFLYEYEHVDEYSLLWGKLDGKDNQYAGYGNELLHLFASIPGMFGRQVRLPKDKFVGNLLVKMWTNFVIHGHPTPDGSLGYQWEAATGDNFRYLGISATPEMKGVDHQKLKFWREMPLQRNKELFPEVFKQ